MGHLQTRKNLSKQEKTPTNKGNTFRARETPFKQEKYISGKETPFKQGVSSDQMQKLTNGRSFRSRQGGCERWRVDIVYWYGAMRRKPRGTGGGDGVGLAPLVVRLRSPLALV